MPKFSPKMKIKAKGYWVTPLLDWSLGKFTSDYNGYWGVLQWEQEIPDSDASVTVDILDSNGNALQEGLTYKEEGIDLSQWSNTKNADIKIRFNIVGVEHSPVVKNIEVNYKDEW